MGRITTHVLDTAAGKPAVGLKIVLTRLGAAAQTVATGVTNSDGRLDKPLLDGAAFAKGTYEIVFHVGDYFRGSGVAMPDPPFLDTLRHRRLQSANLIGGA